MAKINVDMTNVEDGFKLPVEGDYICKVSKITLEQGEKGKYLKWELVIGLGEYKGTKVFHNTSLLPQALFNLRNVIEAMGIDVPKSVMSIDTDKFIGKIVGITLAHRTHEGKKYPNCTEFWKAIKGANGWTRAGVAASAAVANGTTAKATKPAAKPADEIDDVPFEEDTVSGIVDDVEEIDV